MQREYLALCCMMQRGDLTPRYTKQREDFCKNHQLDSSLHHAAARFDSPLHNAAERFDSPLHDAAGSQISSQVLQEFETQFEKNLGYESGSKAGTFDDKKGGEKSCATVPLTF
jgi:hypothetical protein